MRIAPVLICALLAACFSKPPNNTGGGDAGVGDAPDAPIDAPPIGPGAAALIATGERFGCRLRTGQILCWGANDYGQLGGGSVVDYSGVPHPVSAAADWTSVATGTQHACGVRMGTVYCWGENGFMQSDPTASGPSPSIPVTEVELPQGAMAERVFAGGFATCATTTTHEAYCWGNVDYLPGAALITTPQRLGGATRFTAIALADDHGCAIAEDGIVHCWGEAEQRQTGRTSHVDVAYASAGPIDSTETFNSLSSANEATCGTTTGGKLVCWGTANRGQLGPLPTAPNNEGYEPRIIDESRTWTATAVGRLHTCAVGDGDVYCAGKDLDGAVGSGDFHEQRAFEKVDVMMQVSQLAAHVGHTCALSTDGETMKCWGSNGKGELGNGEASRTYDPIQVTIEAGLIPRQIATGGSHTCALAGPTASSYPAYCWGLNSSRQMGTLSTAALHASPVHAVPGTTFTQISAGENHTCGLTSDPTKILCWGSNSSFQLGTNSSMPTNVVDAPSPDSWVYVAAGSLMSCGITNVGELHCWGERPGASANPARHNYTRPSVGYNWKTISIGSGFAVGLVEEQTNPVTPYLYAMATATSACAAHLTSASLTPTQIMSGVIPASSPSPRVAAAQFTGSHTCVHRSELGTQEPLITCFGTSTTGGVGGTLACGDDIDVGSNWGPINQMRSTVFTANDHSCVLDAGMRLVCFGGNTASELGRTTTPLVPTEVNTMAWAEIAGGRHHTCGIDTSDRLWCWGENPYGQNGNGTSYEPSPVVSGVLP